MAVKDYNVDPDLNTTIEGINIAEGCPPSGINNAIRQLMADVKEESEAQAQAVEQAVEQARNAAASDATAKVSTLDSTLREFIEQEVSGAESSAKAAVSELSTELSALETEVEGKADAATVDEKLEGVVRSVNGVSADAAGNVKDATVTSSYTTFTNGLQICTGYTTSVGTGGKTITFPVPFVSANSTRIIAIAAGTAGFACASTEMTTTGCKLFTTGNTNVIWIAVGLKA